ncbi:GGDEF domain-containing protein [Salinicola acroporae]|uniref:diguanylate cyclase n=1 Tax=Salinicola acroporae TaxID=1541440 RepID=A0ABT6I9V0_9GAMM|nr:GGDEF domain-containing protein [Salinicola acroporae]MDH4574065.1 hypothetical protein [Salinicola acroporae]
MTDAQTIDRALRRPWYRTVLEPALERDFDNHRDVAWRRALTTYVIIVALLSLFGLVVDAQGGILYFALVLKLGILLPILLLCLLLVLFAPLSERGRWFVLTASIVPTIAIVCLLATAIDSPFTARYLTVAGMVGTYVIALPIKSRQAISLCALNITVFFGLTLAMTSPAEFAAVADIIVFMSVVMILCLELVRRQERTQKDSFLLGLREKIRAAELSDLVNELSRLAHLDGLTGAGNRRSFDLRLSAAWHAAIANREPLTLMMMDVDHFKSYNDTAGHAAGDACLQAIAAAIASGAGCPVEMLSRYGGEEFALIFPANTAVDPEAIRRGVEQLALPHPGPGILPIVTLSVGVAATFPDREGASMEGLINSADSALYEAKRLGRNRVVVKGRLPGMARRATDAVPASPHFRVAQRERSPH